MATTVNVSSQFVGTAAGQIFVQAFKKADTINKGAITILAGIIGPNGYLPKVTQSIALTEESCGFNPTGTVGYTDKSVPVKTYEIEEEICKSRFAQTFAAQAQGLFAADSEIPTTIQDAILLSMVNSMGSIIETQIWQGAGTTGNFNGLLTQFLADADVIDVLGATSGVNSSNVLVELGKLYAAIPDAIYDQGDAVIVVAPNVARAYKQAVAGTYTGYYNAGDITLDYLSMRMLSLSGLPASNMAAYQVSNVAFMTGEESELFNVKVSDTDAVLLDDMIRTKMVFSAGVGYAFGNEIVWYRPA